MRCVVADNLLNFLRGSLAANEEWVAQGGTRCRYGNTDSHDWASYLNDMIVRCKGIWQCNDRAANLNTNDDVTSAIHSITSDFPSQFFLGFGRNDPSFILLALPMLKIAPHPEPDKSYHGDRNPGVQPYIVVVRLGWGIGVTLLDYGGLYRAQDAKERIASSQSLYFRYVVK